MDDAKRRLLAQLPDVPRWIETRDLLRDTSSSLLENRGDGGFVVWSERYGLGSVVGRAPREAVVLAACVCPEVIAFPENIQTVRDLLPGSMRSRRIFFSRRQRSAHLPLTHVAS